MSAAPPSTPDSQPEPAWQIARLFPPQGQWSEASYLSFTEPLNQLVELVDGRIEVPDTPTRSHQKIVHHLLQLLVTFLEANRAGDAVAAPYRVRLRGETFREPDITVYRSEHLDRFGERFGGCPDLVVEVVSDDPASRTRDYEDKNREYAAAAIPEYWIVDPARQRVLVLGLEGDRYAVRGEFRPGDEIRSQLLPGFRAAVSEVFQAGLL